MYVELLSVETMHTDFLYAADEPSFFFVCFEDVLSLSGEGRLTDTATVSGVRFEDVLSLSGEGRLTDTSIVSGVLSTSVPSAATHFTASQHTVVMEHQPPKRTHQSSSACAAEASRFMPAAREAWR